MYKFGKKECFEISRAIDSIKLEKENLHWCFKEVTETKNALEANLDGVQNQLSSVLQETYAVQSSNAINSSKIQNLDKEVNKLEEEQKRLSQQIEKLNEAVKECKENAEMAINNLTMEADNLCELFLSATQIETDGSKCMKIYADINKLKSETTEKENQLKNVKKELDEYVFYGASEDYIEHLVSLEERQSVMNFLEAQQLEVKQKLHELQNMNNGGKDTY